MFTLMVFIRKPWNTMTVQPEFIQMIEINISFFADAVSLFLLSFNYPLFSIYVRRQKIDINMLSTGFKLISI